MARKTGTAPPIFRDILEGQPYKDRLKMRAEAGILPPAVEVRMWEHVYGKPAETIDLNVHEDLASKSPEELMALVETIQNELKQLSELSASIH